MLMVMLIQCRNWHVVGARDFCLRLTAVDLIKQRLPVELAMTIRNVRPLWDRLFGHDHVTHMSITGVIYELKE